MLKNSQLYFVYLRSELRESEADKIVNASDQAPSLSAFYGCIAKLHLANDSVNDLVGAALAAQIRRSDLALQKNAVDGGVDSRGRRSVAQVREQQGGGPKQAVSMEISRVVSCDLPNGGNRVGDTSAFNIRGGTVDAAKG